MTRRRAVALAGVVAAALTAATVTACDSTSTPRPLAHFAAGGVDVTITLTAWNGTVGTVQARFVPRAGFHLYSVDLPEGGVDGLGVATALGVRGGLRATGPLTADEPVSELAIAGLDLRVPVYPDGPVTTTIGITRTAGDGATADVSYAACSAAVCLVPITDRPVRLTGI